MKKGGFYSALVAAVLSAPLTAALGTNVLAPRATTTTTVTAVTVTGNGQYSIVLLRPQLQY